LSQEGVEVVSTAPYIYDSLDEFQEEIDYQADTEWLGSLGGGGNDDE
jgi:hypothetical protein